jgi:hypothetical protein
MLTLTVSDVILVFSKNIQITNPCFTVRIVIFNLQPTAVKITGSRLLRKACAEEELYFWPEATNWPTFYPHLRRTCMGHYSLRKFWGLLM